MRSSYPLRAGSALGWRLVTHVMNEFGFVEPRIADRFRGFLPVVVDVETGGFQSQTDALLEVAAVTIEMTPMGELRPAASFRYHVQPFHGSRMDPVSMAVNGIDPNHPLRPAMPEKEALTQLFREIRKVVRERECSRAVLVGHNASFDLAFLNAAVARNDIKRNPFHPFSTFDTATLGGVAFGQTVLGRAVVAAGLEWDQSTRAFGDLRCRTHGGAVLHHLQSVPRHVRGSGGTRAATGAAGTCAAARRPLKLARSSRPLHAVRGGGYCLAGSVTPASVSSCCNSPFWNISLMMSEPPSSSPLTYSWGYVGQFECRLSASRNSGSSKMFT